jgi:hypothetical protein
LGITKKRDQMLSISLLPTVVAVITGGLNNKKKKKATGDCKKPLVHIK